MLAVLPMNRLIVATTVVLGLLGGVEARAQTPAPAPPAPRPQRSTPSTPTRPPDLTLTVVGCLRPWAAVVKEMPGPAAAPAGTGPDHRYVLTDVKPADPEAGAAAPVGAPAAERYIVTAIGNVNLAAHVERMVRIVGNVIDDPTQPDPPAQVEGQPPPAPVPQATTPPMPGTAPSNPASRWPSLVATSITSAGPACRSGSS
jgi:hypothetical protein